MVGDVAQLVEHMVCNHGVVGSNPIVSTSCRSCQAPQVADDERTEFFAARARARAASRLFDKLGEKQRNDRRGFSSENPVKLHKVHVRMPWHQEPTKDVA